ncbi:hypothetical protein, partial [Photobacterium sp. R1]
QDVLSAETDTQQDDIDSLLSDLQTDDSVAMAADSADSAPNQDEDIETEGADDVDEAVPHSEASAAEFDETEAEPEPEAEPEISLSAEQDAEAEASEQDVAEQAAPDAQILAAESAQA